MSNNAEVELYRQTLINFKYIRMNTSKIANMAYWLVSIIAMVVILWYGKNILIPFVLALILWYLKRQLRLLISKIKFRGEPLPLWLGHTLAFLFIFVLLAINVEIVYASIQGIQEAIPIYESNISIVQHKLDKAFNIDLAAWLIAHPVNGFLMDFLKTVLNSLAAILGKGFIILFYVIFLVLETKVFEDKLRAMYQDENKYNEVVKLLHKLDKSLSKYLVLKTLVSLLTGILSYVVLAIIGVDFALFWAFLIFLLNYIPTIGSLVATLFPTVIALLQGGSFSHALMVLAGIGVIQLLVGNFVEPKVMGNSLNVSSLVVILSLILWGSLWGIIGMIIAVPMTVILIIIFAQFPASRKIAIVLSKDGIID